MHHRPSPIVVVALGLAAAVLAVFFVVGAMSEVPPTGSGGRRYWPGSGFVILLAMAIVAGGCLVDALLSGRRGRRGRRERRRRPPGR